MSATTVVQQTSGDDLAERLRQATLGRYDIYAEIGRGGMAAVFLALDLALNRKVALKVMLPELVQGHGAQERFRREARTAASLSHPHIIPVYAVGEDDGLAWFAMKYVDGRPLDSVLGEEGAQSPAFVQAMLRQVASALDYAHRRGVIHRDIKPANILLDEGGWFILTDFGIAKATDDVGLTSSGMLIGTPAYMSPEHFEGKLIGAAADQYALGCVAYELLAGTRPFACATVAELMRAHMLDEPTAIELVRPDCPGTLARVVARALRKDPAARFPSADDLVHALDAPSGDEQRLVTAQISTLARSGAENRPRISQPVSPVPLNRTVTGYDANPPRTMGHVRRRSGVLGGLLVATASVAVWGAWRASQGRATATNAKNAPVADTTVAMPSTTGVGTALVDDSTRPPESSRPTAIRPEFATAGAVGRVAISKPPPTRAVPAAPAIVASTKAATSGSVDAADRMPAPATDPATVNGEVSRVDTPSEAPAQAWFSIKLLFRDLTLYVDGRLLRVEKQRTIVVPVSPGRHVIEVRRNECPTPFVDAREFTAGDTVRYNNKGPCPEGL